MDSCNEGTKSIDHTPNDSACGAGFFCSPAGCANVDECTNGTALCGPNSTCVDSIPGVDGDGQVTPPYSCPCNAGYQHPSDDPYACVSDLCTPVVVGTGTTRCFATPDATTVNLYLEPNSSTFDTPWQQSFDQDDEPVANYCGPTAGMNLFAWYGIPASYPELGQDMGTNNWDNGAIVAGALAACGLDPICTTIVAVAAMNAIGPAGSPPSDVGQTLLTMLPPGYVFCANSPTTIDQVHRSLVNGNPIVVLVSAGSANLHWEVITGLYTNGGDTWVRLGNSDDNDKSWSDFQNEWSLAPLGLDSTTSGLLSSLLGIGPNVSFRYEKLANLPPLAVVAPFAICP